MGDPNQRGVVSATPIAIVPRAHIEAWTGSGPGRPAQGASERSSYAGQVFELLQRRGAMFTRDIEAATGLLRPHLEEALKQLVYEGCVTADAFSPLRWLLRPERQKARIEKRRGAGGALPIGRWSLVDAAPGSQDEDRPMEARQRQLAVIAKALLRRYGVVFRAVIQRETLLPPWRYLLQVLRRMEDRGELLGGRFVDGFSGEQFALPEAVGLLRQSLDSNADSEPVVISAADPLNLGGWILPGPRTPMGLHNRVLLEDGLPVARMLGEAYEELPGISDRARRQARQRLTVVHPWRQQRP
jgi:ATP-dependent Lhr-like helicase